MATVTADAIEIAIEKLTVEQKLALVEKIWASIPENALPCESPEWHGALLAERRARIERGETKFSNWEDVKKRMMELGK